MADSQKLERNVPLLCAFHASQMALFPLAIITIFWQVDMGLSTGEIVLLQGIMALTVAVMEFPSGYLADMIGYRKTLGLSAFLMMMSWAIYIKAETFGQAVVAEVFQGVGWALVSGSDTALMFESLKSMKKEGEFTKWSGRMKFFGQSAEGTAALGAGLLYTLSSRLPFMLETGVWLINMVLAFFMKEPERQEKASARRTDFLKLLSYLKQDSRILKIMFLATAIGLSSFIPVWLIPLYAKENGVTDVWLGPLWAGANYMVAIGAFFSHRFEEKFGDFRTLLFCLVLVLIAYLGLGLTASLFSFLFYYLITFMRGVNMPILTHSLQKLLPSQFRASMFSVQSLIFRLSFALLSPVIAWLVDGQGYSTSFLWIGGVAVVAVSLLLRAHHKASL